MMTRFMQEALALAREAEAAGEIPVGCIIEKDGVIAGYALLCKTWSQEAGGKTVWIDELYVLPEFRGQGIGHEFFDQLQKIEPAARYRLEIEPDNLRAKALYESMGFEDFDYRQLVMDIK